MKYLVIKLVNIWGTFFYPNLKIKDVMEGDFH